MNENGIYSVLELAKIGGYFARREGSTIKPRFKWTESKHYVPYNTYMKVRLNLRGAKDLTTYYDVYNEILYLGSWVLQDD